MCIPDNKAKKRPSILLWNLPVACQRDPICSSAEAIEVGAKEESKTGEFDFIGRVREFSRSCVWLSLVRLSAVERVSSDGSVGGYGVKKCLHVVGFLLTL